MNDTVSLNKQIEDLKCRLEEKNKVIEEAIDYINKHMYKEYCLFESEELLKEILKKGKKTNTDNIEIDFIFNNRNYSADSGIKKDLVEGKIYYLADDYKEPTKIKFMGYEIMPSIENKIIIMPCFLNLKNDKFEYYNPKNVYKTANKASEAYLKNKGSEIK